MGFKVGDVVILKSGGPPMTIEKIDGDVAHVVWMVSIYKSQNSFAVSVLNHFEPTPAKAHDLSIPLTTGTYRIGP